MIVPITQEELERLLKESEQIANDWNTYLQFRRNRDAILREYMPQEGMN
ncbi:MAG: hypothetical protein K0Q50_2635 [Vampirovibrio sp.]|jgi:hypothetical protein|nr:hypothetical protein [Vampirovibrio sp.]